MAYITRNANIVLLFLILISAASVVGATVFFQINFDRINAAYAAKRTQLENVAKQYDAAKAALDQIKSELTLKSAREEEFTQQYTTVRGEKTQLEGEKQELTKVKQSLEDELQDTKSSLQSTQDALEASKNEANAIKVDLAKAQSDVVALKKKVDGYQAKVACLQSKNDSEESSC